MPPKTSAKATAKSGEATKADAKGDKKKRKGKRNSFVNDLFERIAAEASKLVQVVLQEKYEGLDVTLVFKPEDWHNLEVGFLLKPLDLKYSAMNNI